MNRGQLLPQLIWFGVGIAIAIGPIDSGSAH